MSDFPMPSKPLPLSALNHVSFGKKLYVAYRLLNGSFVVSEMNWKGFGRRFDSVEGILQSLEYTQGFDFADEYGISLTIWPIFPSQSQLEAYPWKDG